MSNVTLNSRLVIRNDTATNWGASSLVLLKGEVAYETDTGFLKIGDGASTFSQIPEYYARVSTGTTAPTGSKVGKIGDVYIDSTAGKAYRCFGGSGSSHVWKQIIVSEDLGGLGYGDMLKSVYDTDNNGVVDKAEKLNTARTISISGDATGDNTFDGSANTAIAITIAANAVTNAKLAAMAAYTLKGNNTGSSATPTDITILDVIERGLDGGTTTTTIADAEYIPINVSATSLKKITWANMKTALGAVFAALSHTHGNITNDGKIGSTADKAVYTGTAGLLQAGTLPIAAGGTNATSAVAALSNLGGLGTSGDASNTTVAFTQAGTRANVATGETLAVLFGKVAKWFADLGALAFKGTVATADITDSNVTNAKLANMAATTIKGNKTASAAAPTDLTAAEVRTLINVADGAEVNQNAFSTIVANATNVNAASKTSTITFTPGSNITITGNDTTKTITIAASHPTISTQTDDTSSANPTSGGTFTAVDSVTRDTNGHVLKINLKTVTLPIDPNTITRIARVSDAANVTLGASLASGDIYLGDAAARVVSTTIPSSPTTAQEAMLPTVLGVKNYVDALLAAANAMVYKGVLAGGAVGAYGALTPAADAGDVYIVSVAGKIDGVEVEIGDMLICKTDSTIEATSGNYATVVANWNFIQTNISGAVIGPASSVSSNLAAFDGTTGKLIKDSGIDMTKVLLSTDTYILNGGTSTGW